MTPDQLAVVITITSIGALVHGSTGIGMALVAAPILAGVDPGFTPAPLMLATQLISARHVVAERHSTDREAVRRCLLGLPIGVAAALLLLSVIDDSSMALFIGAATAAACALLLIGLHPPRTERTEMAGGAAIAFAAVAAGLPGPPGVVTFNDLTPSALRGTLSTYMAFVVAVGLTGLLITGALRPDDLLLIGYLLPGILIGLVASRYLRHHLDRTWFRPVVLVVAMCGGLAVVARELL
ncbi:MAG: sulfite exporter TauE/SafE family protein [Actinomycetota bacterium]